MAEVYIDVTGACNLSCRHCYAESDRMNHPKLIDLLDTIDSLPQGMDITFIGGEPLIRKDIQQLVSAATAKKGKVSIVTNATLLTETLAKSLINAGLDCLMCSLDGPTEKINDWIRGKNTFKKIVHGIKIFNMLSKSDFSLVINCTINSLNYNQVKKLGDFLDEEKIHYALSLDKTVTLGTANSNKEIIPSQRQWMIACDQASSNFKRWTTCTSLHFVTLPYHLYLLERAYNINLETSKYLCPTMKGNFYGRIFSDGKLYSCGRREIIEIAKEKGIMPWEGDKAKNVLASSPKPISYPETIKVLEKHFKHPDQEFCRKDCPVNEYCSICPITKALGDNKIPDICQEAIKLYPNSKKNLDGESWIKSSTYTKDLKSGGVLVYTRGKNSPLNLGNEASLIWKEIVDNKDFDTISKKYPLIKIEEDACLNFVDFIKLLYSFGALNYVYC